MTKPDEFYERDVSEARAWLPEEILNGISPELAAFMYPDEMIVEVYRDSPEFAHKRFVEAWAQGGQSFLGPVETVVDWMSKHLTPTRK